MLTCRSKNVARSEAMTMSPVVTQSRPAPQQIPLMAASTNRPFGGNGGALVRCLAYWSYVDG